MIRAIPHRDKSVFLTFDDGPDGDNTERVLDVLREQRVRATFFLIAQKLRGQERLVRRMIEEGHTVGNHSWDHGYRNYFRSRENLKNWIVSAREEFNRLGLPEPVGFRPPAGVITPGLKHVLGELREPLVLWNERFYDGVWAWDAGKAMRSAARIEGGSVVLLHDRQKAGRGPEFCRTLNAYIERVRARGLEFEPLSRELCTELITRPALSR